MESILFTVKSNQSLTIGDLLQAEMFECTSVSAKKTQEQPTADSKISDFQSVQYGVKGQSSLGFRLSFDGQEYQLSVPDLATASDWTGALLFLKSLMVILDEPFCYSNGDSYDRESILEYNYTSVFVAALSELAGELKVHPRVELMGIRRPIYIDEVYLSQIIHVSNEELLDSYDQRLRLTQQIRAYFSEQQVFKVEQAGEDFVIPVNYLNSQGLTVLPAHPELEAQYRTQYQGAKLAVARLFIMDGQGKKLAEVPYRAFLESLTEGIFMLDAKNVVVEPISEQTLKDLVSNF